MDSPALGLFEVFTQGQVLWEEIEAFSGPRNDDFQKKVIDAIQSFKQTLVLIEKNSLFSSNELLDDIPTSSLKYLSVHYYLGELLQKRNLPTPQRLPLIREAKACIDVFLSRVVALKILSKEEIKIYQREGEPDPETRRNEKIARYKAQKAIKERISAILKEKLQKGLSIDDDDDSEFERETSLLFLQQSALAAMDNIKLIAEEINILEHMMKAMADNNGKLPDRPPEPERVPFKPIVIGDPKQAIAANAFKPGWNLPTVSIEEAGMIDHKIAMQEHEKTKKREAKEKLVKEFGDPDDDEVEGGENNVFKKRDWDDWKDDNPKGSGNTGTKGYNY